MKENNEDRFDQWIDRAMSRYSDVEPRAGLENRVLSRLLAKKKALAIRWWAIAFASIAVFIAALGVARFSADAGKQQAATSHGKAGPDQIQAKSRVEPHIQVAATPAVKHTKNPATTSATARHEIPAEPRLTQFPSPRPLSAEEKLLEAYVNRFPGEAVLVAHEQTQRREELERLRAEEDGTNLLEER